jgi:hypothetical protein
VRVRVVAPWVATDIEGREGEPGPRGTWRVWVEEDRRWRLAGVFAGTETEAVSTAVEETGATRVVTVPSRSVMSAQTTLDARRKAT